MSRKFTAVILAGGKGTRMKSEVPKVLHELNGEPLVSWVVKKAIDLGPDKVIVVESPERYISGSIGNISGVEFIVQDPPLGTGHAVLTAERFVSDGGVLTLYADSPLLNTEDLKSLIDKTYQNNAFGGMLSASIANTHFGIVKRNANGDIVEIVQYKDATEDEKKITEVDAGPMFFRTDEVFRYLKRVPISDVTGEIYLTRVIKELTSEGKSFIAHQVAPEKTLWGINTQEELQEAYEYLNKV